MKRVRVERSVYLDSIVLMGISRKVGSVPGVATAMVAMATDTNLLLLKENGFDLSGVGEISSGDLVIAIDARDEGSMAGAVAAAASQIAAGAAPPRPASGGTGPGTDGKALASFSLEGAFRDHPEINLVLISLPGKFAAREAEKALRAGRHVMIFSDNVSLEDEKRLKALAAERGLLVMGPDCGTAVIGGVGLGFANHLPPGPVGIVAASGTGAQEVSSILARMGIGVTHIIGTGGRDVTDAIGGASTLAGLEALIADGPTRAIVIISKLPSPRVSEEVLRAASAGGKPCVIYFAGYSGEKRRGNLAFAGTLTEAALEAAGKLGATSEVARALGGRAAASSGKPASDQYAAWRGGEAAEVLAEAASKVAAPRRYVRGLYSGGTLAQEAIFVFGGRLGPVSTNMKLPGTTMLEDPRASKGHTVVDLGDDAFTRGRAHPMIDQSYRLARLAREIADPETAVVLLDVVLGYGCNPDPGGEIAQALRGAIKEGGSPGPVVIASVCGTAGDPQGYDRQKEQLASAGVLVAESNAVAAEWAAQLVGGR